MAANATGLADVDKEFSDWIEIYNPGQTSASLAGWSLTDDASRLQKWQFPPVSIPAQGFLIIFASGKDRRPAVGELHANFQLDANGEFLALVQPDGTTLASGLAGVFPRQVRDVSYGLSMTSDVKKLLPSDASGLLWVPTDSSQGLNWMLPEFVASGWIPIVSGVGYDRPQASSPEPVEPVAPASDVSQPGDFITATSPNSPSNETVINAIDNNSQTKYLNFDKLNAGLTVTPSSGEVVVTGLRLTSANDAPERDPTRFTLSGSHDGANFSLIATGTVPTFTARFMPVSVTFTNTQAWKHFRLLFPTVRDAASAVAVQIAEVELLGWPGGPPPEFGSLIRTNIESRLYNRSTSAYLRFPFLGSDVPDVGRLALYLRYEDGFVAWLNGVEVARANAPQALDFNARAVTNRSRFASGSQALFNISDRIPLLRTGSNVLAIQGLNSRIDSRDFLLEAELEQSQVAFGASGYLVSSTPRTENSLLHQGLVDEVAFSVSRGFHQSPFDLLLECSTPGAVIRYTTDGSEPNATHGLVSAGPISIRRTTCVRAIAVREGWHSPRVVTHTYLFLNDVITQSRTGAIAQGFPATWVGQAADYGLDPRVVGLNGTDRFGGKYTRSLTADLESLPTLSVVAPIADLFGPQGIYANPESRGSAWERAISLELLYPDHRPGFQENAGIRIQGGAFRRFDLSLKKSFRVVFQERYGASKLRFPLFGPDAAAEFDNFVLRANSNDAWPYGGGKAVYVRDAFAMATAREFGIPASHSEFMHLYINGQYWGLYNPVERPDAAFASSYVGGDRDLWDSINQDSAPDGNYDAWNRMLNALNQDLTRTENYQRVQGNHPDGTRNLAFEKLIDVENLIDYMILNFYMGNTDWPGRNWWAGRSREGFVGFQFRPWDTETTLDFNSIDVDVTGVNSAVARPFGALRVNADFRMSFADHVFKHFFNGGPLYVSTNSARWDPIHPENNRPAARFASLAAKVRSGIVGESARWGDQLVASPFTRDEHWQPERDSLLNSYFPLRSARVIEQFRRAGLYPRTDPPSISPRGGTLATGATVSLSSRAGIIYYTTNGTDPRKIPTTALRYSGPIQLGDLTTLRTRVLNGSEWSALHDATFVVGTPKLHVSEVHYHPAALTRAELDAGFTDADSFEYLELHNPGATSYDLRGIRFTTGIQFGFATSSVVRLPAGGYVLLVKNRSAFAARYGSTGSIAGEYGGKLDNAGERIVAVDGTGQTVIEFLYGTRSPWPNSPDGKGPSLVVVDAAGDLSSGANWKPSVFPGGSPGESNEPAPFQLTVERTSSGDLMFRFPGRAGLGFTLYTSDSLVPAAWKVMTSGDVLQRTGPAVTSVSGDSGSVPRFFKLSIP
ncbi:MAG: CotH kinase family protein [Verrucomicrobiales bacterium]|nr:CotH kinase family protein [Verrucomicrobiales bacterium]